MASVRDELRRIHDANGGELTPEVVVASAKPVNSPLHSRFEWDDSVAGHKYRLVQAGELIREQRVEYARDRRGPKSVRAYTSTYEVGAPSPGVYKATEDVVTNDLSYQIMQRNFDRALADIKRKFGHLKEFREKLRDAAA
jgi:hypothetical protein